MVQDSDTIERMMRSDCGYEEFYEESSRLAPDCRLAGSHDIHESALTTDFLEISRTVRS